MSIPIKISSEGPPDSKLTDNPGQSDNFDTFNKFAKLTSISGGDNIIDRKVIMNQLA
jgi:hypothetical protein